MVYCAKTERLVDGPGAEYHNIWAMPSDSDFREKWRNNFYLFLQYMTTKI